MKTYNLSLFKKLVLHSLLVLSSMIFSQDLLIPMDEAQTNHLKSYGLVYWAIEKGAKCEWLLNYRGGSFKIEGYENIIREANIRGISYELLDFNSWGEISSEIIENNMDIVKLEKAPKIAVYTPPGKFPWDDAVTLALTYAEIPYKTLWDKEVLSGQLSKYDWLHLHHEDFTGQYGKFYKSYHRSSWYIQQQINFEKMANELGFKKVSKEKLAVVFKIKQFMLNGGFLFAMCSAADTFDIALAASKTDICAEVFDGDGIDTNFPDKLDYRQCLAFKDFEVITDPYEYEHSSIDFGKDKALTSIESNDYFALYEFSAKYDPIPAILTQNHTRVIKNFFGQCTSFRRKLIKKNVVIMGDVKNSEEVKYIHSPVGSGFFTFLGGHDPEDYKHFVNDPQTDLNNYKNSPGYRLILNNILLPATNKKKKKT